MSNLEQTKEPL